MISLLGSIEHIHKHYGLSTRDCSPSMCGLPHISQTPLVSELFFM